MAYTGSSIVDYLKSVGKQSSFASRTTLAGQFGIQNYAGTSQQNLNLLGQLRTPTTPTAPPTVPTQAPTTTQTTNQVVDRARQVLAQTQAQGNAPFAGSSFDTSGTQAPPTAPPPTGTQANQSSANLIKNYFKVIDTTQITPQIQAGLDQFLTKPSAQNRGFYNINGEIFDLAGKSMGMGTGLTAQGYLIPSTPPPTDIGTSDDLANGGTTSPDLGAGSTAGTSYLQGLEQNLQQSRSNLDKFYQDQLKSIQDQQAQAQARIDQFTSQQEGALGDIESNLQPFREELEKSERQRLKLEENYFANQQSVQELETLLTQAQAEIQAQRDITGLGAIRNPRIAKITEEMSARVGVIEAVMAARNNQISVAEGLIDRSIDAITADRQDQLKYYETIFNFYQNEKDDEGNRLITLTEDEQTFIEAQVNLLQNDLEQAQANSNYIKQLMLDPATANLMDKAGVKLTDSIDEINKKISKAAQEQQLQDQDVEFLKEGFQSLSQAQAQLKPANEITEFNGRYYWKKAEADLLSVAEAKSLGVPFGTTKAGAFGITPKTTTTGGLETADIQTLAEAYIRGESLGSIGAKTKADVLQKVDEILAEQQKTQLSDPKVLANMFKEAEEQGQSIDTSLEEVRKLKVPESVIQEAIKINQGQVESAGQSFFGRLFGFLSGGKKEPKERKTGFDVERGEFTEEQYRIDTEEEQRIKEEEKTLKKRTELERQIKNAENDLEQAQNDKVKKEVSDRIKVLQDKLNNL